MRQVPATADDAVPERTTAGRWLNRALYAFALVGWELVLLAVEPVVLGPSGDRGLGASVLHWLLTALGWAVGALLLARGVVHPGRRADVPAEVAPVEPVARPVPSVRDWLAMVALVVACIGLRWAGTGRLQVVADHRAFTEDFGSAAVVAMAAQLLYYLAEVLVLALIVVFGQRAGDARSGRPGVPWGGVVLALTWGSVHVLLQGPAGGAFAVLTALALGGVFLLSGRRLRIWYPLAVLAFVV